MADPFKMTPEQIRAALRRDHPRLEAADDKAAKLFSAQLAEIEAERGRARREAADRKASYLFAVQIAAADEEDGGDTDLDEGDKDKPEDGKS